MATPEGGKVVPFEPGVIDAVGRGIARALQRASNWFGPGEPLHPVAPPEVEGRAWDYPAMANIQTRPRVYEPVQFTDLRFLSESCEIIRLCIETRKDQLVKLKWKIKHRDADRMKAMARKKRAALEAFRPKPKPSPFQPPTFPFAGKADQVDDQVPVKVEPKEDPELKAVEKQIEELEAFFRFPDKRNDWATWFRIILDDLFVLDAPTLYVRKTIGGDVWGFEPIDGATISPMLDAAGRQPLEGPAYMQTIKGLPAIQYTPEQLVYKPRNRRSFKAYGYSPVEQIVWLANLITRRELHKIRYYTDGSTPDLIFRVPEGWTPDQVKNYKKWWDRELRGDSKARRGTMFVVGGMDPIDTKEKALKDEFDEWLARLVCYAFSLPPQPFVKETNRATAENQQEASLQEGLEPLKAWVKALMDDLLGRMGKGEYEFGWDEEEVMEPLVAAQIAQIYVNAGIKTKDEARDDLGLDPLPEDPTPPPPPAGAAPTDSGTPPGAQGPVPGSQPQAAASDVGDGAPPPKGSASEAKGKPPAKKLHKATQMPQINRDRPSMQAAMVRLQGGIAERLQQFAKKVSRKVGKAEKREHSKDLAEILTRNDWEAFEKWLAKELGGVYLDGAEIAASQIGISVELPRQQATEWALKYSSQLIKDIEDSTVKSIQAAVAQSTAEGWSSDELAQELRDDWAFSKERAETIARTEIAYSDIEGNRALYQESGLVSKVMWITADADPCDACAGKNGEELDLGSEELPPEHPNCRCDVVPVVEDDEGEKLAAAISKAIAALPAPTVTVTTPPIEIHTAPITVNLPDRKPQRIVFGKNAAGETVARPEEDA